MTSSYNTSSNRGFFKRKQLKFLDVWLGLGNPLQIFFESYELRESVEFKAIGIRQFGDAVAAKLRVRCADIASSASVYELSKLHKTEFLFENGCDYITINLTEAVKMYFVNGHLDPPRNADSSLDWHRVTRLKLVHIGENYGF